MPIEPMFLLFNLQDRGFTLTPDPDGEHLAVQPYQKLTQEDCDQIRRWKQHLLGLLAYEAPTCA